jgi:hypothetical protein
MKSNLPSWTEMCRSAVIKLKITISRSSVLTTIVIVALLAATPFAIWEFVTTGELYVLSHRFYDDLVARVHGPGRLRFIFQPTVAAILGVRDGIKDAREGNPPYLFALAFHAARRSGLLRSALTSVRDLVAVAILLDIIAQLIIFRIVHPGAALLLGPVLIATPYAIARALANRFTQWRGRHLSAVETG